MNIESIYNQYKEQILNEVPTLAALIESYLEIPDDDFTEIIEKELNAFIRYDLERKAKDIQAKKNESESANDAEVQRGFTGQIIEGSGLKRANQYPNAFELDGNDEPQQQYNCNVQRDASLEFENVHLRASYEDASTVQSQSNEHANVANTSETDLERISTNSGTDYDNASANIPTPKRQLERITVVKNTRTRFENRACKTDEQKEALKYIRKNYSFPFNSSENGNGLNALSAHFYNMFGMSKSTWASFIKRIEFLDELIENIYEENND